MRQCSVFRTFVIMISLGLVVATSLLTLLQYDPSLFWQAYRLTLGLELAGGITCLLTGYRACGLSLVVVFGITLLGAWLVGTIPYWSTYNLGRLPICVMDAQTGAPVANAHLRALDLEQTWTAHVIGVDIADMEPSRLYWHRDKINITLEASTDSNGCGTLTIGGLLYGCGESLLGKSTIVLIPETYAISVSAPGYLPIQHRLSDLLGKVRPVREDRFLTDRPLRILLRRQPREPKASEPEG
ncbi:MAG: hypothetical protein KatS3mg112_0280 [Thermogutta sp.]|nr:MAG: hypothetical protein KatS3mg112_0280 [Thermogutta sp.]